jgi:hypothetical protein
MKLISTTLASLAVGSAMLVASSVAATAAVVCRDNVCWHVTEPREYPADAGVVVHEDNWRWRPEERYEWREHEGHGYWRDGAWITIGPGGTIGTGR